MFSVTAAVNIPFVAQFLDDDRVLAPNAVMIQAATDMLDELVAVQAATASLRASG